MILVLWAASWAADWPAWGLTPQRNMVSVEKKVPKAFDPGRFKPGTDEVDVSTARGLRWVAKVGSQTYGNPTVVDGRVYVGTNNQAERRPGISGDYSVVMTFDDRSGELLWQLTVPKMGSGKVNDWEYIGICSSPTVVGEVVYVLSSRGEMLALDVHGLANGNQGMQEEGAFMAAPGRGPEEVLPMDADILWSYDMPEMLGVFPHNVSSSSPLIVGDKLFISTSNGVDWSHLDLPSPFSPALVAFDRRSGALIGEEAVGISERTLHANWSSPTWVPAGGGQPEQVVFGAGDGFLYAFEVEPVVEDGLPVLKERWRVDANPPEYRGDKRYPAYDGPSELISTPVHAEGLIYAVIGQDPEHGPGLGMLSAVRPDGTVAWQYKGIGRSISTVAVYKGLVYAADYEGRLHCVDARTGAVQWVHDTGTHLWGSPVVAGGRVWLGDEDGVLTVLQAGRKLKVLQEIAFPAPIYSTPVFANGNVYVASQTHLYAFDGR